MAKLTTESNKDFLLEIGCEELPPNLLVDLVLQLKNNIAKQITKNHLSYDNIDIFCTSRRLAVLVNKLQTIQKLNKITKKGPKLDSDKRAIAGFAKSCNVDINDLVIESINNSKYYTHTKKQEQKNIFDLLPVIVANSITAIKVDKAMRWGDNDYSFSRPIRWLVALLNSDVVAINIFGLNSDRYTYGLRFTKNNKIAINKANDYQKAIKSLNIEANFNTRKQLIKKQILSLANKNNILVDIKDNLLNEVCALVECPCAFLGNFATEFLELPEEVLILTIESHQKYFPVFNKQHKLQALFIGVANTSNNNIDIIVTGNQRVIKPRLADAKFFLQQDKNTSLENRLQSLKSVLFMQSLGSLYDKSKRLVKITEYIADKLAINTNDTTNLLRASLLSKSDLASNMVIELPKLQGVMGGYYALHDNENKLVADIISEHYKPRFSGDSLPNTKLASLLAIADKLDTIVGIYATGNIPTGSKDPYALRRLAIGVARIIITYKLELNFSKLVNFILSLYNDLIKKTPVVIDDIINFIFERLKVYYLELGINVNIYNAVILDDNCSIYDFDKRIHAVAKFSTKQQASNLITLNKRIFNILRDNYPNTDIDNIIINTDTNLLTKQEELLLLEKIKYIKTKQHKSYQDKMLSLCDLELLIDNFFAQIMVNSDDKALKNARIYLLIMVYKLLTSIADISKL